MSNKKKPVGMAFDITTGKSYKVYQPETVSEQMPPEFEFIYPFAKGTFSDETSPHFGEDTAFLSFPKKGKCPYTGKKTWVCEVSASQHDQPCSHFKEWRPNITLTLTRDQSQGIVDILTDVLHYGPSEDLEWLKKQIEEKLK